MSETLIVGIILFAVLLVREEIDKRRNTRREAEYVKLIRSLQNRISARDLGSYLALEENDRPKGVQQVQQRPLNPNEMFDAMSYSGTNGEPT